MTFGFSEFATLFAFALFGLLPIANPLSSAAVLLGLTAGYPSRERNRQANRATLYVAITIVVTYFIGHAIMSAFGVTIPGLRLAGGMIVSYVGFTMLFPADVTETEAQVDMAAGSGKRFDEHGRSFPRGGMTLAIEQPCRKPKPEAFRRHRGAPDADATAGMARRCAVSGSDGEPGRCRQRR